MKFGQILESGRALISSAGTEVALALQAKLFVLKSNWNDAADGVSKILASHRKLSLKRKAKRKAKKEKRKADERRIAEFEEFRRKELNRVGPYDPYEGEEYLPTRLSRLQSPFSTECLDLKALDCRIVCSLVIRPDKYDIQIKRTTRSENPPKCVVCYERTADVITLPCEHQHICFECCMEILFRTCKTREAPVTCVVCRERVMKLKFPKEKMYDALNYEIMISR